MGTLLHFTIEDLKNHYVPLINHVVCHGIPSDRVLNEGDAINVDVTAILMNIMEILVECFVLVRLLLK